MELPSRKMLPAGVLIAHGMSEIIIPWDRLKLLARCDIRVECAVDPALL